MKRKLTVKEILDYEVRAIKITSNVSNKYIQNIIGWWIGRKVNRKYNNYIISLDREQMVNEIKRKTVTTKCPKCGGKLEYMDYNAVLLSSPPQRQVKCVDCSYLGYVPA